GPDAAAEADLTVVDPDVEPARGVAAHPGLVGDRRPIATVVRERQQHTIVALATLGEIDLHPDPSLHLLDPSPAGNHFSRRPARSVNRFEPRAMCVRERPLPRGAGLRLETPRDSRGVFNRSLALRADPPAH